MKLECNFHEIKEVALYRQNSFKAGIRYLHIYEYHPYRYGSLSDTDLTLYMVALANHDNFASDQDIKKGFYTYGQAINYADEKYDLYWWEKIRGMYAD